MSHRSQDIIDLCDENNIELVFFVPNSTHIFKPLDLSFFSAFKAKLRSAVPEDLDKQTRRLDTILRSWDEAKKVRTIRASFEMAGFLYDIVGDHSLVVSFSRDAVRA